MVVFVVRPVYFFFVAACVSVGAVHRSRVISRRGLVGIREGDVTALCFCVDWGRGKFFSTCLFVTVVF